MSNFSEYITKQDERWDTICFKAYGVISQELMDGLVFNNPNVSLLPIIATGTRLKVPVLEPGEVQLDSDLLPPWKR